MHACPQLLQTCQEPVRRLRKELFRAQQWVKDRLALPLARVVKKRCDSTLPKTTVRRTPSTTGSGEHLTRSESEDERS